MTVIDKARELGKMIQADERFISYTLAKETNDSDEALQMMINEFNDLRMNLNAQMSKNDKDSEKIAALDVRIKEQYQKIMSNENMIRYTQARNEMDNLMSQINTILAYSANGEDPETCSAVNPSACGGNCTSCGGCG